jgi:hypothetical protein
VINVVKVKWDLRKYLRRHHIPEVPKMNPAIPRWGKNAQLLSLKVCGSRDIKVCAAKLAEATPASRLRAGIVHGYQTIMGAKEGGAIQRAIARFCGISTREPWCAETFWYVAKKLAGYDGPAPDNIAFVPAWELFAKAHDIIVAARYALPGMGCTFVWSGTKGVGKGMHIGTFVKTGILKHTIRFNPRTDEGNAGGAGGDAVREVVRYWWQINVVFDIGQLQK